MPLSSRHILIVDDEAAIRDILEEEFATLGAHVHSVGSVKLALELLAHRPVDLVISDIRMPEADGLDLLREVRSRPHAPPVVLITGFADISLAEAHHRGAEAVLNKPFDLDEVCGLGSRLVLPVPARWGRVALAGPIRDLQSADVVPGRGGFLVRDGKAPPAVGAEETIRLARPDGRSQRFRVLCQWHATGALGPLPWGAEILAWDDASAAVGWEHGDATSFIPNK